MDFDVTGAGGCTTRVDSGIDGEAGSLESIFGTGQVGRGEGSRAEQSAQETDNQKTIGKNRLHILRVCFLRESVKGGRERFTSGDKENNK